jgi:predicted CoA-binding protein
MAANTRAVINDFLRQRRLALVGISRNPYDFTRKLFRELHERGYDVVPVSPTTTEIEGVRCYPRVQEIVPAVDGAIVLTQPEVTYRIVRDCADAGITRVWLHRGEGISAATQNAITFCQEHGIQVVPGFCPYMFLPNTPFLHRFHAFVKKVSGSYPA